MGGGVRKLYRHSSNEGSVIEFDYWGTWTKLFVADAKYRGLNLAYDTAAKPHNGLQLFVTSACFNGSRDDCTEALPYNKDDAWIQSTYEALKKDGTAKSNTDKLMAYSTTQAAHHCRDQNIPGVGQLDLPNIYELIVLYLESDNIDALDPTVESNRDKALGMMNTNGRFYFGGRGSVWSTTGYNSRYAWSVGHYGAVVRPAQVDIKGVVPVKELDT